MQQEKWKIEEEKLSPSVEDSATCLVYISSLMNVIKCFKQIRNPDQKLIISFSCSSIDWSWDSISMFSEKKSST